MSQDRSLHPTAQLGPRLGTVLLISTPAVDLVLFAATVLDLRRGASAEFVHGLAAACIGFSVAFGHRSSGGQISGSRTGSRVARRRRKPPPKGSRARVAYEWRE